MKYIIKIILVSIIVFSLSLPVFASELYSLDAKSYGINFLIEFPYFEYSDAGFETTIQLYVVAATVSVSATNDNTGQMHVIPTVTQVRPGHNMIDFMHLEYYLIYTSISK